MIYRQIICCGKIHLFSLRCDLKLKPHGQDWRFLFFKLEALYSALIVINKSRPLILFFMAMMLNFSDQYFKKKTVKDPAL